MDLGTLYTICKDNTNIFKIIGGFLLAAFVLREYVQNVLLNVLIFSYLSYKSMTLLNSIHAESDLTQLLKYWVIFAALIIIEYFVSSWIGIIYTVVKLAAFVLLLQNHPYLTTLYDYGLVGVFDRYESSADKIFSYLEDKANSLRTADTNIPHKNYNVLYWFAEKIPYLGQYIKRPKQKKLN
jgi:hypothetical protein